MKCVVTGADGFIGRNLTTALCRGEGVEVRTLTHRTPEEDWSSALSDADVVYHLAGVNRPIDPAEFGTGNVGTTRLVCSTLMKVNPTARVVLASSTQATSDNPYGNSKRDAEALVFDYASVTGAYVIVYRLPGVFGKWSRPNYNSVVATFCHNLARDLSISVSDAEREIALVYIDDVVQAFVSVADGQQPEGEGQFAVVEPVFHVSLGELASLIRPFRESRLNLQIADMTDRFVRSLYATYLSFLPPHGLAYALEQRCDYRGELGEFLKAPGAGQLFISRTRPGITRGNHYHDSKVEKFFVVDGEAIIRFREFGQAETIQYPVSGREMRVLDIPPGYTHSIENVGESDLIVLFWANEIFDPVRPDTFALLV